MKQITRPSLLALLILGAAAILPAQRGVRVATTTGASAVALSPDGTRLAFRTVRSGAVALGVMSTAPNSTSVVLVANPDLTNFYWAPDSQGLYYQTANILTYVRVVGGSTLQVANVTGRNVRLYGVDATDGVLVGTRTDTSGLNSIFKVNTNGKTLPVDFLSSAAFFFGEVSIDPTSSRVCYTAQLAGLPHAAIEIRAVQLDGMNDVSLSGGSLPRSGVELRQPSNLSWLDANRVVFEVLSVVEVGWMLARVDGILAVPELLTMKGQQFRGTTLGGDFLGFHQQTFHGNLVPGIMPKEGGARIPLEPELNWITSGSPSLDATGRYLVFSGYDAAIPSGRPEAHLIELDREIRVSPRPALNAKLDFLMPVAFGEQGTLFLSTGLASNDPAQQFHLPGFDYAVALDASVLVPLGSASNSALSFSATVPNDTALLGFTVYLQGMRVRGVNPDEGDFTRYAELQFLR